MRIVVTGGTGFLGKHLCTALVADRHDIVVVSRTPGPGAVAWAELTRVVDGAGAVVHLAGATIARRWSEAYKRTILESRVQTTRALVEAVRSARARPAVVISQSAVGYYGPRGEEELAEETPPGDDFLAHVCRAWEAEAAPIATSGVRLVTLRTGVVLARDGGALARMGLPFRLGIGGPMGDGRQAFPWIHVDDWVGLVRFALDRSEASGPLNAAAPGAVTHGEFARAFGRALRRPAVLRVPAFALRWLLGEMAEMLLTGQRAIPRRALALGYRFRYATLEEALRALVTPP